MPAQTAGESLQSLALLHEVEEWLLRQVAGERHLSFRYAQSRATNEVQSGATGTEIIRTYFHIKYIFASLQLCILFPETHDLSSETLILEIR